MADDQAVQQQAAVEATQQPTDDVEETQVRKADPNTEYTSENEVTNQYIDALKVAINDKEVIKIFDNLLTIATEDGASDIHIEPFENTCRMRIRIDGVLIILMHYPQSIHENIIAKFKIESGQMRPDEKRLPQDARVSTTTLTNKELDLRANTIPTVW
jgi:general secretion pathway protein E